MFQPLSKEPFGTEEIPCADFHMSELLILVYHVLE